MLVIFVFLLWYLVQTTLARIIANNCRSRGNAKFVSLSAAVCGVNEVKDTIKIARNDQKMFRKKTVMFLDEIHRFNKMQQVIELCLSVPDFQKQTTHTHNNANNHNNTNRTIT